MSSTQDNRVQHETGSNEDYQPFHWRSNDFLPPDMPYALGSIRGTPANNREIRKEQIVLDYGKLKKPSRPSNQENDYHSSEALNYPFEDGLPLPIGEQLPET